MLLMFVEQLRLTLSVSLVIVDQYGLQDEVDELILAEISKTCNSMVIMIFLEQITWCGILPLTIFE
jgi:hypothetical protein